MCFYFREKRTFRFRPLESMDRVMTGRKLNTFSRFAFQRYYIKENLTNVCSFIDSLSSIKCKLCRNWLFRNFLPCEKAMCNGHIKCFLSISVILHEQQINCISYSIKKTIIKTCMTEWNLLPIGVFSIAFCIASYSICFSPVAWQSSGPNNNHWRFYLNLSIP